MRFVATNVCIATATKTKRLLKRNGQPTLHPRPPQCLFRQKEENIDVFLLLDISQKYVFLVWTKSRLV